MGSRRRRRGRAGLAMPSRRVVLASFFGGGDGRAAAGHGDDAGAGQFLDAVGADQFDEGVDFFFFAGDLDHHGAGADVHDVAAEQVDQFDHFAALARRRGDFDQGQVALDEGQVLVVAHAHDGDDLGELLAHLLEDAVVGVDDDGHAGEAGVFGAADHQRINVEAAGGKHAGHMGQHAGFIHDQGGNHVSHRKLL